MQVNHNWGIWPSAPRNKYQSSISSHLGRHLFWKWLVGTWDTASPGIMELLLLLSNFFPFILFLILWYNLTSCYPIFLHSQSLIYFGAWEICFSLFSCVVCRGLQDWKGWTWRRPQDCSTTSQEWLLEDSMPWPQAQHTVDPALKLCLRN